MPSVVMRSCTSSLTFGVLPLFAFANAGVSLAGVTIAKLIEPIPLGISAGLVIGKPVGVFLFSGLAILLGIAARPEGTSWLQLLGAGLLAGIGFTMSIFIASLAFTDPALLSSAKLSVLAASSIAAVIGLVWGKLKF